MVEVSSFCAEISNDPNVAKKEKSRVKKDFDLVKERQSRQEKEATSHKQKYVVVGWLSVEEIFESE